MNYFLESNSIPSSATPALIPDHRGAQWSPQGTYSPAGEINPEIVGINKVFAGDGL